MLHWHAIITRPNREVSASVEIVAHGFEAYLPTMQRRLPLRAGGGLATVARFSGWAFARFDATLPGWEQIGRGVGRTFCLKVKCDSAGIPIAMPERAIDAMRAYKPPAPDAIESVVTYAKGAPVMHYTAGVAQQAVFVRHLKQRAQVELWILGRPRTVTVALSALEEMQHAG